MTATYCPSCGRFHANSTGACTSRQTVVGTVTHSPDFVARTPEGRAALLSSAEAKLDSVERWLRSQDEIAALRARVADLEAERDGALTLLAGVVSSGVIEYAMALAANPAMASQFRVVAERIDTAATVHDRGTRILEVVEAAQAVRSKHGHHPTCDSNDRPIRPCDCGYQALCDALLALRHLDATPVKP